MTSRYACSLLVLLCAAALSAAVEVSVFHRDKLVVSAPRVNFTPEIRRRLQMRISVDFQDRPFCEVVDFLRRHSGVNMIVGTDVRRQEPAVSMTVNDMRLENFLSWLGRVTDVDYHYVDEAVFFTNEPMAGEQAVKIYDVGDLLLPVRDFPGPDLTVGGGSRGGQGFDIFAPAAAEPEAEWNAEELADIIRNQIAERENR